MWIGSKYLLNLWAIHSRSFLKTVYKISNAAKVLQSKESGK